MTHAPGTSLVTFPSGSIWNTAFALGSVTYSLPPARRDAHRSYERVTLDQLLGGTPRGNLPHRFGVIVSNVSGFVLVQSNALGKRERPIAEYVFDLAIRAHTTQLVFRGDVTQS